MYFLMFGGWHEELQSNRWHYAVRWARRLPVALVQADASTPTDTREEAEPRIPGCSIIHVDTGAGARGYTAATAIQISEVAARMRRHGHRRPILWCYNPRLVGLYAALPAVARVYHATENYFDFDGLPRLFLDELRTTLAISDLVVAVSDGVARDARAACPAANVDVITNGCDFRTYGKRGARSDADRSGYARLAVFGGNINARVDFDLVGRAADAARDTLFLLVGPVADLPPADLRAWRAALTRPNVRLRAAVAPETLAALYASADVGLIPYKRTEVLVANGFPLKTLEMAASGLPVVSTYMEPIVGLAPGIVVCANDDEFVAAVCRTDRAALGERETEELVRVAAAHDYDAKFEDVLARLSASVAEAPPARTRVDAAVAAIGPGRWLAMNSIERRARRHWSENILGVLLRAQLYSHVGNLLPHALRRTIPADLRRRVRERMLGR